MANYQKVKVLVVGDSGVGKTAFVNLLCYKKVIANPNWTIGTQVELLFHDYQAGTPNEANYTIELWDIGGYKNHKSSRKIFYNGADGIILMYDVTNKKSEQNLYDWLEEILSANLELKNDYVDKSYLFNESIINSRNDFFSSSSSDSNSMDNSTHSKPILVIGTHLDQVYKQNFISENQMIENQNGNFSLFNKFDEIIISNMNATSLAAGCSNSVMLCRYFDRIISRKTNKKETNFSRIDQYTSRRHVAIRIDKSD